MKIITLIFSGLLLGAALVHGQEAAKDLNSLPILPQPLPAGDLISQAPDPAHWTIISSVTSAASAAAQSNPTAPKTTVINVTKSGKLYLVESVGPDGKKMVRWKDHQYQATYISGVAHPLVAYAPTFLMDGSVLYYMDFSKSDFPEFSWISASNYVGMTKVGAGMGLVFKASVPTKGTQMALLSTHHSSPSNAIAVVDLQSRRPLMLQVEDEVLLYQFTDSGTDVTLPPEVQQAFDSWRKQIRQASRPPPG
jgi:hypothetical protein